MSGIHLSFKMAGNTILVLLGPKGPLGRTRDRKYDNLFPGGTEACGKPVAHTGQLQMVWKPCHSFESQGREVGLKFVGSGNSADASWEQLGWVVVLHLAMGQLICEPMGPGSLPCLWDLRVRVGGAGVLGSASQWVLVQLTPPSLMEQFQTASVCGLTLFSRCGELCHPTLGDQKKIHFSCAYVLVHAGCSSGDCPRGPCASLPIFFHRYHPMCSREGGQNLPQAPGLSQDLPD